MSAAIPLGPFEITHRIGVGGQGEVWAGRHRSQDVPVAVKVLTSARARQSLQAAAFRHEVRAMAGLDHPGIVHVFDYGAIDEAAARAAGGALIASSPFLAMELAPGGSLAEARAPSTWRAVKEILLAVLDALAHAHARGLVHRDLKPHNVLLCTPRTGHGPLVLRLADFGLAHAVHPERSAHPDVGVSGTPVYMAPEQFRSRWWEFGPCTDLYALGCVAYELATGVPPFPGPTFSQLLQAHLQADPPALTPRMPVPDGFEAWLLCLLAKSPTERFQRAADAAWALVRLGDVEGEAIDGPMPFAGERPTLQLDTLLDEAWDLVDPTEELPIPRDLGLVRRVPPLPPSWQTEGPSPRSMSLVGAGLGLYGLRTIPLVDRELHRDAMWDALHGVRRDGRPRALVLLGGAGTGKSRLAQWLAERADEVGSARVLRVVHGAGAGRTDGLARMVARTLGCTESDRAESAQRTESWLRARGVSDPYEWHALVEVMWPAGGADEDAAQPVRFGSADERYAVLRRFLEHAAAGIDEGPPRPVVLWLDDVHWGDDTLSFARYLLDRAREPGVPVLLLLTVRDDLLADRPVERALLDDLLGRIPTRRLEVPALEPADHSALVERLLGLEGELAVQIEARTAGNPLFAVQLVGDWVQRGVLEVGRSGFVLRRGERAEIPDDIHDLWAGRIEQVVIGRPDAARTALWLAALLGRVVDPREWEAACTAAGTPPPDDLQGDLFDRRLAVDEGDGWALTHGMLRESLVRSARESGTWLELHAACATALRRRYDVAAIRGLAERLARHLLEAGSLREALEPLARAAAERRATSDYAGALLLVDERDAVMRRLGLAEEDVRWGEGMLLRAKLLPLLDRLADARALCATLEAACDRPGWEDLHTPSLRVAASAAAKQGKLDEAIALARRALDVTHPSTDLQERAWVLLVLARCSMHRGQLDAASASLGEALQIFTARGNRRGRAQVAVWLGAIARQQGALEQAAARSRSAIALYEELGNRYGLANAHNELGELLRAQGQDAEAEREYRRSEALFESLGTKDRAFPLLNRGLVLLLQNRDAEGRAVFEEVLTLMEGTGRQGLLAFAHALLLAPLAMVEDWAAFDLHLPLARQLLASSRLGERDVAWALERAGEHALASAPDRAAEVFALAASQHRVLGSPTLAQALDLRATEARNSA